MAVLTDYTHIWCAGTICNAGSLDGKIEHLKKASRQAAPATLSVVPCIQSLTHLKQVEPTSIIMLSYQHHITNKISRLLAKHSIKTIHIPSKKIFTYLVLPRTYWI